MDNGRVRIQPDDVSAFLDALRPTKNMALLDARGAEIGHVSLAGLSAALLFMDDQQKRIGTVTALIRKGPNPASAVPAPPALPMIVSSPVPKAPPRLLTGADQARLLKPFACEHKDAGDFSPSHIRLDSKTTLALLPFPCGNGAYNYVALALQIDERGRVTPALFDSPPTYGEDPATNEVIGSAWDAEKRTLTSYSKDRGLGDCGLQTEYVWDGTRFRLILQEEMRECRGSVEFITLWRATVVRR